MSTQTNLSTDEQSTGPRLHLWVKIVLSIIVAGALALAIRWWGVPFLWSIDENFSYKADVLSLDNFFDEAEQKFVGEARSVTTFGYRFAERAGDAVVVNNFFDVRTVQGDTIIAIERALGLHPQTWRHQAGAGDRDRGGYLFAPRHLKAGETFSYWHVNYDKELELVFEAEEVVNGLRTYRYSTSFGVDQTQDLTHLPGVPDERGINLDVSLTLWVEPVSGWLVHYQDKAIAYYYDIEEGTRLHPWNKFSNRFRQSSILEQVQAAGRLKIGILTLEVLVPLGVFVLLLAGTVWRQHRRGAILILIGGVLIVGAAWLWLALPLLARGEREFVIGISRWVPEGNTAYDENIQGFKDSLEAGGYVDGRDVSFLSVSADADSERQLQIAEQFSKQNVDLVYSLTTPGTLILKDKIPHRPIVFSVVTYPVESGLIASLRGSGNNLVGTRNWVPVRDQLNNFLELVPTAAAIGFIHRQGEPNSTAQLTEMQAAAERAGLTVVPISPATVEELPAALADARESIDSFYSACDALVQGSGEDIIIAFAREHALPTFSCNQSGVEKGDLIGTVADFYEIGRLAGEAAVQILEGVAPTALETRTVARPFIYINAIRAHELGIIIPQSLQAQARNIIR